jgi:hypothetical protein
MEPNKDGFTFFITLEAKHDENRVQDKNVYQVSQTFYDSMYSILENAKG